MAEARLLEHPRQRLLSRLPVVERRLELAGVPTAVLEGGEGPPMVLLHGPGEHAAKWMRLIPCLVARHRVIAPDLPGHGNSEVGVPLEAERVLAWLGELLERTCPEPATLVGQILGGAIAARFAVAHGKPLERLVLADALGLAPFQPTPQFGAALAEFLAQPSGETHDALWRRCAFDLDALRARLGERWEWLKAYNLDRARAPGLGAVQHGLMEQFGMPAIEPSELARIRVPVTLIWGRHDLATPLAVAETASTRYGWPLRVIEDSGDDPPLEQPEAFLRALG
jgi:pimeloyl-ACP methyl ester carboxylesterase